MRCCARITRASAPACRKNPQRRCRSGKRPNQNRRDTRQPSTGKRNVMDRQSDAQQAATWRRRFLVLLILILAPVCLVAIYLFQRFGGDTPVDYASVEEHFKYGSTGGEHEMGFPYWIWRALPQVCAEHLPGPGYESLGMIFEPGKD